MPPLVSGAWAGRTTWRAKVYHATKVSGWLEGMFWVYPTRLYLKPPTSCLEGGSFIVKNPPPPHASHATTTL